MTVIQPQSVIFLDVDGVLVHMDYANEQTKNIDPENLNQLKRICDTCQAAVVISSS